MLGQVFGTLDIWPAAEMAGQVLLALLLGGLVGIERERRRMPAGVRTFMLVSVGSCIFTILSHKGFSGGDPSRVAAQIVSGIGFLGAGVVLQRKGTIYGLTSAAGVWAVAAVGMAVGTGSYFVAVFGTTAIIIVLGLLRRWFKVEVVRATRRTLNAELRQIRERIAAMGNLVTEAILASVQAVVEGDRDLAHQLIEGEQEIDDLRDDIENECLDILRTHRPEKIQLRTVVAASHIAASLERIADYAIDIARLCLQANREPQLAPTGKIPAMATRLCDLLRQALTAFCRDDVVLAERVIDQMAVVDRQYDEVVEAVTEVMSEKKTRHFGRGAYLLNLVALLRRTGDRVATIAQRVIFTRTGALADLEDEE